MMQIIKYKWENWKPVFTLAGKDSFKKIHILENKINFNIGKRSCIGYIDKGKHFSCPTKNMIESGYYCNSCISNDFFFKCVTCDGSFCKNTKRRVSCAKEKYYIYLSSFGPVLKVGISNQFRLTNRLVEQGADIAARIACVQDGKEARLMEQRIKEKLNIVDRLDGAKKHQIMFGDPNIATINILEALGVLKGSGFSLMEPEIYDLRRFYGLENVHVLPKFTKIKEGLEISGKIVAAKGNLLVLKNNEGFFSFNAHSLIGHSIDFCES